jgi:hypothetical protein
MPVSGPVLAGESSPPHPLESYKVFGNIDDIKPAVTCMQEFILIDHGSALHSIEIQLQGK